MTLIECFDESALENIAACLLLDVDKLILLGDSPHMEDAAERYRALLDKRNKQVCVELRKTGGKELGKLTSQLRGIVLSETKSVIDLNGGDELTLMAVGVMLAGLDERQRKRVSVQRFDPETGNMRDCDGDGIIINGQPAVLTVAELISIYGGTVYPGSYQPPMECTREDLQPLWELVSRDPRGWNRAVSALIEFEKRSLCVSENNMDIFLNLEYLCYEIAKYDEKEELVRDLLEKLRETGIIEDHSRNQYLSYTYKSSLARYCTEKAGNVLEIKTLLEGRALRENGMPYFQDCRVGVSIDWDGEIHDDGWCRELIPETRNEIDLILTRGMRTLFISCKNGNVEEAELYKLHTVATRFGGPNVRKMLIVANLDQKNEDANNSLVQRAEDMGIHLVKNAAKLTPYRWQQIFRDAMQ